MFINVRIALRAVVMITIHPTIAATTAPPNQIGRLSVPSIIANPTDRETSIPVSHAIKFNNLGLPFAFAIVLFGNLF